MIKKLLFIRPNKKAGILTREIQFMKKKLI